ncbi:urea ABC transporter ATP-binding subunit UrtE [Anaerostipes sp.]|uniref:urea ABC transporter ATP-binding subunit UrtE n=1 Tax=Anaerostipes sp. TaxID=1872530 RepID=UPI0025C34ACB|nr:urea ABC transporter ATP-binding subunit UrtE [Anaerostipes sp.]MBS7007308.1 urea ABC transporter ATP-binding subunit UrtE [Anaerostipes sp.]
MLEIQGLYAAYGEGMVLRDINLQADKGSITCLVGRNGAGKTTLMKSIMGLLDTPKGSVKQGEKELSSLPSYMRAKSGIGYVPQGREIFPQLTVRENLLLGLEAGENGRNRVPEDIFDIFPILKEFLNRKGGDLSGGQQQQLAIARAMVSSPQVLILDEPTEGIQPSVIEEIGIILLKLKENMAVFIAEQYLEFVMDIADDCYVMENGEIIMHGKTEELDQIKLQATMSL